MFYKAAIAAGLLGQLGTKVIQRFQVSVFRFQS